MLKFRLSATGVWLFLLVLIAGIPASLLGTGAVHAQPAEQDGNLLTNPGFEPFITPEGLFDYPLIVTPEGGGHVAEGWLPWWYWHLDEEDIFQNYVVPEYDIAPISRDPFRVRTGNAAQQIFRPATMWKAGVYQTVMVPTNAQLQFSIYGHAWAGFCKKTKDGHDCGDNHDSNYGEGANPAIMRVGIDPYGGTDWTSPAIVWSQDYNIHDHYEQLVVTAQANGSQVTVFTYTTFVFPAVINNVYWDDAALVVTTGTTPANPPPAPPGEPTGLVLEANGTINVRTGPGTDYAILGQIQPGTLYTVLGQSGDWYSIDFNGQTGYVYSPLTTVTSATVPDIPPGQGIESTVPLNVRTGPGIQHPIIGVIYPGAIYLKVGQQDDWYQIDYNGTLGWVYAPLVVVH
jgi:uncharacterized protein YraI